MDQTTPRAFADQWTNPAPLEHVWHQVAARTGHLVYDHHLRSPDSGRRAGERETISGNVVEVSVEVARENLDDVVSRRAAAVEAHVNNHTFLVLLREVVTIETAVTGLPGVGEIDVG